MHCPSCGNESSLDQKFCRQCGFNLEPISKLVVQRSPSEDIQPDKQEQEKALVRRMFRIMGWGLLLVLAGVVLWVMTRGGFAPEGLENLLGLFGLVFLLGGTAVAGYSIIDAVRESTKPALPRPLVSKSKISQAETTNELLEGRFPVPVPSVTERTTQLIATESKAGKPE